MRLLLLTLFVSVAARCMWRRPNTCNEHLSDGPEDADIEIRLGGLPASDSSGTVHLQWHAARKSPTEYNPLVTLVNASVYTHRVWAYPSYEDADFNGGNVRVSEAGEATVRVRAPAAYVEWIFLSLPHVHLRLCYQEHSSRSSHRNSEVARLQWMRPRLEFDGREVVALPHSDNIAVLSATVYAGRDASAAPTSSSEQVPPEWYIASVRYPDDNTTTLPPESRSTTTEGVTVTMASSTTEEISTTMEATTTTEETTTAAVASTTSLAAWQEMVDVHRERMDLDALEFSPVYNCLLERQLYDNDEDECTTGCSAEKVPAHGQCVRAETADPAADYSASWQISMECGEACWEEGKNVTLHKLRLFFAGQLTIPFQEVKVAMSVAAAASGRRLTDVRNYVMSLQVQSNRVTTEQCRGLVVVNAALLSDALGLTVRTVAVSAAGAGSGDAIGPHNDPYVTAYDKLEKEVVARPGVTGTSPLDFLPSEAIIGMAAGVVVLAIIVAIVLVRRRRRLFREQEEANANATGKAVVKAKKIDEFEFEPEEKNDVEVPAAETKEVVLPVRCSL